MFGFLFQVVLNFYFQVEKHLVVLESVKQNKTQMDAKWYLNHWGVYLCAVTSLWQIRTQASYLWRVYKFFKKVQKEVRDKIRYRKAEIDHESQDLISTMSSRITRLQDA